MKFKYSSPEILIEDLERSDVLLSSGDEPSGGGGDPVTPKRQHEYENIYRDITSFFIDSLFN